MSIGFTKKLKQPIAIVMDRYGVCWAVFRVSRIVRVSAAYELYELFPAHWIHTAAFSRRRKNDRSLFIATRSHVSVLFELLSNQQTRAASVLCVLLSIGFFQ